jgi:hypothetical protein
MHTHAKNKSYIKEITHMEGVAETKFGAVKKGWTI